MTTSASPNSALSHLLVPAAIQLNLAGPQRDEVLREMVALVPALTALPQAREELFYALVEREALHSTGIGDGIAIPHARNALAGLVEQPTMALGRHPTGVPYGAIDGVPVRLFFLVIAPSVTQHLAILARLSRLLRDRHMRTDLLQAPDPASVIKLLSHVESRMFAGLTVAKH
jgi:mannitol/fructose-specific phosphotransferase system IIA component (Ntr-type)